MLNNNEISAVNLSATKRDFYQDWNELLEIASKISSIWDPTSTNESDPGIVLLKVLVAALDKLNYLVDINTNEAFMPSAAQEESMRKLCDALGYNMKYYQSAETEVSITYIGDTAKLENEIEIPQFTKIYNADKDITYVTIETKNINKNGLTQNILCMEGQEVICETENNNLITMDNLDDNLRFYLPENQIAENGIFIYSVSDDDLNLESSRWEKVDNLNTENFGKEIFKFGYDSRKARPYVQFPEDVAQLIGAGLHIYYIRTSGMNGNISAKILSTFEKPSLETWQNINVEDFNITNNSAATNGANPETLNDAYLNYTKTIGTFETLTTCRDYMNKIYQLVSSNNIPLVSNVIVSDIRDDINNAITLCTFENYGLAYIDKSLQEEIDGELQNKISNFDLILYPFTTVQGLNTKQEFDNSFKYSDANISLIQNELTNYKTISHIYKYPTEKDIVCIKNYLKLDAKITTTTKVNAVEEASIKANIKTALFKNFNSRKLSFGDEIPFDTILETIEKADVRIKNVSLDEPVLYTKFLTTSGEEYDFTKVLPYTAKDGILRGKFIGREAYNKIALKNILAGKLELFNYNTSFKTDYSEADGSTIYPSNKLQIVALKPTNTITIENNQSKSLSKNELIRFRAPNFKTTITYPAYVYYNLKINNSVATAAIPATFTTIKEYMTDEKWTAIAKQNIDILKVNKITIDSESTYNDQKLKYGAIFDINGDLQVWTDSTKDYYIFPLSENTLRAWNTFIKSQTYTYPAVDGKTYNLEGIFRQSGYSSLSNLPGYLVDKNGIKYSQISTWFSSTDPLSNYFVQETFADTDTTHTFSGLGTNATYTEISANEDYQLKEGDRLSLYYTPASDDSTTENTNAPICVDYYKDTIIRPNITLRDSDTVNKEGTGWAKARESVNIAIPSDINGFFSLGVKDQIEIREQVKATINSSIAYLYWTFDEKEVNKILKDQTESTKRYTLKDGEYLYITDINKTSFAYYGNGTELVFTNLPTFSFTEINKENKLSADDILNNGIAGIPWVRYSFSKTSYIEAYEYEYVNLLEGDKISYTNLSTIDNTWREVDDTLRYNSNGSTNIELRKINVQDSSGNNIKWQVQSKLLLDTGPDTAQELFPGNIIEVVYNDNTSIKINENRTEEDDQDNLFIKSNYTCQSDSEIYNATIYDIENDKYINDFKIITFKKEQAGVYSTDDTNSLSALFPLHNFGEIWTSIQFNSNEFIDSTSHIKLWANIPENNFGLVMIHCAGASSNIVDLPYIQFSKGSPKIYNKTDSDWWDTLNEDGKFYLRNGINIIEIDESTEFKIYPDQNRLSSIVISDLDLVNKLNPINLELIDYQNCNDEKYKEAEAEFDPSATYLAINKEDNSYTKYLPGELSAFIEGYTWYQLESIDTSLGDIAQQLLADINKTDPDHEFYYNLPIENSNALDLFKLKYEYQSLSSARTYYDYNNVANKFTISEIDSSYLDTGINITRSSRK